MAIRCDLFEFESRFYKEVDGGRRKRALAKINGE